MTGDQMRLARINQGYSIRGLAKHLGIHEQTVRRLERGEAVHVANAKVVADFYDVKVTDLMPHLLEEAA